MRQSLMAFFNQGKGVLCWGLTALSLETNIILRFKYLFKIQQYLNKILELYILQYMNINALNYATKKIQIFKRADVTLTLIYCVQS